MARKVFRKADKETGNVIHNQCGWQANQSRKERFALCTTVIIIKADHMRYCR